MHYGKLSALIITCITPLIFAVPTQFTQAKTTLDTLIEKAQQKSETYKNPLIKAVLNNDTAMVQSLVQKGTKTTITLPGQLSLLFVAIKAGNSEMIDVLLQGGTNIDKTFTIANVALRPIEYALLHQNEAIINLLLQKGARIFTSTKNLVKEIDNPTIKALIIPSQPAKAPSASPVKAPKEALERAQQSLQEAKKNRRDLEKSLEGTKKALAKNQKTLEKEVTSLDGKLALMALQKNIESLIEEMENIDRASRNEDYYAELIKNLKKTQ